MTKNIKTVAVTIREIPGRGGWLHKETGRVFKTAAGALRAVERDGKRIAKGSGAVAHIVTWEPTTPLGEMVIDALTK